MDKSDCPTLGTVRVYDVIAACYMQRTLDRSPIKENLERFTACMSPGGLVLDIGCGPGFDAALLRSAGFRTVAVDLSLAMISLGRTRFPGSFVLADMRRLPFKKAADGLWVNASLLHLRREDVPCTLAQFHTALKHSGALFVAVKDGVGEGWEECSYHPGKARWFTYWTAGALKDMIHGAGFEIVDVWSNGQWVKCLARRA